MVLELYAIRDVKLGLYRPPFPVRGLVEAMRGLSTAANNPESELNKYPLDFELHLVGKFDDESGSMDPHVFPQFITKIVDLIKQKVT